MKTLFRKALQISQKPKTTAKELYKIGAAAWLLADLLDDSDNIKVLRRLKELLPSLNYVSRASFEASKVYEAVDRYTRNVEKGRGMNGKEEAASGQAMEQFLQSSEYLERWIDVLFKTPSSKHQKLDTAIRRAIDQVNGNKKDKFSEALEWLATQPETVSAETVRNKLIEIKNR